MPRLTVAFDKQHFLRDGEPFFWVGDTVWSAFTNATDEEWADYLDFRKAQGFNVLQINTLPQWDRIRPDLGVSPYPLRPDGSLDWQAEPDPVEDVPLFDMTPVGPPQPPEPQPRTEAAPGEPQRHRRMDRRREK